MLNHQILCERLRILPSDEEGLNSLSVPFSAEIEARRLQLLRDSKVFQSNQNDPDYDRISHLALVNFCLLFSALKVMQLNLTLLYLLLIENLQRSDSSYNFHGRDQELDEIKSWSWY